MQVKQVEIQLLLATVANCLALGKGKSFPQEGDLGVRENLFRSFFRRESCLNALSLRRIGLVGDILLRCHQNFDAIISHLPPVVS